jgi:hypothetical protein
MRTTLNIDDDVMETAKRIAEDRRISVGEAVSLLARRGTESKLIVTYKHGFPSFDVPGMKSFTTEDVKRIEEQLDREEAEHAMKLMR